MPKILLGAAVIAAGVFAAPSAYAAGGGGGPTPYWASPWYSPNEPSATLEGRSVSTGGDVAHDRRAHRRHRPAPALEQ